jgi:hypothetical protein
MEITLAKIVPYLIGNILMGHNPAQLMTEQRPPD